jgi:hypothetical protein
MLPSAGILFKIHLLDFFFWQCLTAVITFLFLISEKLDDFGFDLILQYKYPKEIHKDCNTTDLVFSYFQDSF